MGGKSAAGKRGKRSRQKGNEFERAVAIALRGIWPAAKRGVGQSQAGNNGADVEGTPFWIECKTGKSFTIKRAFEQADAETDGRPVIVVSRRRSKKAQVSMRCDMFVMLVAGADQVNPNVKEVVITVPIEVFVCMFRPAHPPDVGVVETNGFNESQGKIEMDSDRGGTPIEMDSDIPPS